MSDDMAWMITKWLLDLARNPTRMAIKLNVYIAAVSMIARIIDATEPFQLNGRRVLKTRHAIAAIFTSLDWYVTVGKFMPGKGTSTKDVE